MSGLIESSDNSLTIFAATMQEILRAERVLQETVFAETGYEIHASPRMNDAGSFMLECSLAEMPRSQFRETAEMVTTAFVNNQLKAELYNEWDRPKVQRIGLKIVISDSMLPH